MPLSTSDTCLAHSYHRSYMHMLLMGADRRVLAITTIFVFSDNIGEKFIHTDILYLLLLRKRVSFLQVDCLSIVASGWCDEILFCIQRDSILQLRRLSDFKGTALLFSPSSYHFVTSAISWNLCYISNYAEQGTRIGFCISWYTILRTFPVPFMTWKGLFNSKVLFIVLSSISNTCFYSVFPTFDTP